MFTKKLLLASVCCLVLGCHNSAERAQDYLTKGMNYYKQGDYSKARIELKNVLQIDAKKADAFYYLALIDEKEQNWSSMFSNLSQTVALNPKNNDAHLKLGKMQLLANKSDSTDKAMEQVNSILKNAPNDPGALILKAGVLFKDKDVEKAQAIIDTVLKQDPNFSDAINLKISLYLAKNDFSSALTVVNNALVASPKNLSFYELKLQIHARSKNIAAIEQDFLDIIKQFPDKLEFNYQLAKYYADKNENTKAEAVLQNTIKNNPTNLEAKWTFVDYLILKNPKQVETVIKTYLIQHPNEPELTFRLARFYFQQQKYLEAKQFLELIAADKKDSKEVLTAKMFLAQIALKEDKSNKYQAAMAILKDILAAEPTYFDALMLQAKLTLSQKQVDEAISQLRNIMINYPKSDEAMVLLAQAYSIQNTPELAEESFHKALEMNPNNLNAIKPLVSKLMQDKDYSRAAELVQRGLNINPNNLEQLKLMAQIKLASNDWDGVKKIADSFSKQPDFIGFSHYLNGKVLQSQKKYTEALIKYKEAITAKPELLDALKGIVECYENLNQRAAMFIYLDTLIKAHPDEANLWLLKAQFLAFDKRPAEAIKVLTSAIAKWPKTIQFYIQLAKLYTPQESDKAMAVYRQGLAALPDNIELQMDLAALYEHQTDYVNAIKMYETILAKQPDVITAANNLASLLMDYFPSKANFERAVKLAAPLATSEEPYFLDTYAWSLVNSDRASEAIPVLQKVTAKASQVVVFSYHLAMAYHKAQNDTAAVSELNHALILSEKTPLASEKKQIETLLNEIKPKK